MTGHLVFSTIHTNDAPSSLSRLVEMHVPTYMVAATMKAVLAQRLGRRVCADCAREYDPKPEEIQVFKEHHVELPPGIKFKKGEGCDTCKGSGFKGRVGFHELLLMSEPLRRVCLQDISATAISDQAMKEGMRTIMMDGLEKVKMGWTTVREVLGGQETEEDKKK
jgi:type II secretory ATPase GspE/PulE/Tfp pilus assembly ATPase PilB-like protein